MRKAHKRRANRPVCGRPDPEGNIMSKDIALKAAVATQLRVSGWKNTAIERMNRRADKGQTSVEYIGMLVAVIAIIAIVVTMKGDIGKEIGNKIKDVIGTSGKSG